MPRLVILHPTEFRGENYGVFVQHVETLAILLEGSGWAVYPTDLRDPHLPQIVLAADLVLVQMLSAPEVEAIVRTRRERELPTVYEVTDNLLGLGGWLGATHLLRSPLIRAQMLYHASLCDALQVYAPGLAELFSAVNPRIVRFDPYVPIGAEVPPKNPGFVVGWGGTTSHASDLAAIAPVVVRFCLRHPDATFAYMGERALFDRLFGAIDPRQTSVRPFGTHSQYLEFVAGLHVGLAPLAPGPFNSGRTDTRFVTYAAHAVAGVLQDGPVYGPHRERACIFRDATDLDGILEELWAHPHETRALGRRAYEWARAERSEEALAKQRDDAYRSLVKGSAATFADLPAAGEADAELRTRLRAAEGLEAEEALRACEDIVGERPSYEQAHLVAARRLVELDRYEEALASLDRLTPSPIYADVFLELQIRCARRVCPHRVGELTARISSPTTRARLGTYESVLARSRAVLEHQPYDHFALSSTIRWLLRTDPGAEELDALFARACLVAPEEVPPERRPVRLAPFLPV